ncbi:HET domain containing protein [Hyaloscypha variabilis]
MSRRFVRRTVFGAMREGLVEGITGSDDEPKSDIAAETGPDIKERNRKTGPPYQYPETPLLGDQRQIRLLELLPGTEQDDITCNILLVSLNDFPIYEALSYCWGDTSTTVPIEIKEGTFEVTKNLRSALFHLRRKDDPRTLWIDAVCINQDDLEERAQQVSIMRDIYKGAVRTVVWLGDVEEDSEKAFSICRTLADYAWEVANPKAATSVITASKSVIEGFMTDCSVEHLVERRWWKRVWVVQEVALATEVLLVCGSQEMDWDTFCVAVETGLSLEVWQVMMFGIMDTDCFKHYKSMTTILRAVPADTPGDRLLELLIHLRMHEATDDRDKVFSVLGLLDTSLEDLGVLPDYQDSWPSVFKKTAASIIENSRNLDVLGVSSTNHLGDSSPALPSWVPDWRYNKWIPQPFRTDALGNNRRTSASQGTKASPIFLGRRDILVLSGHPIDSIAAFAEVLRPVDDSAFDEEQPYEDTWSSLIKSFSRDMEIVYDELTKLVPHLSMFIKWEAFANVADRGSSKGRPAAVLPETETAYWQTLCAGCTPNGPAATEALYREWYASLGPIRSLLRLHMDKYASRSIFKPIGFASYLRATWERYPEFANLLAHAKGRRLARTQRGRLCLVPAEVEEGDAVVLVKGGRVPLVIRYHRADQDGTHTWKLVGECYVHGLMDGEAFDLDACRDIRLR